MQTPNWARAVATTLLVLVVIACGSPPDDAASTDPSASPIPFTDSMAASGEDLKDRLTLDCAEWEVSMDPAPGEHYVRCHTGGERIFWAEVIPDTTGHHAANPSDLVQGLRDLLATSPDEACEHYGGGPFVAGVNWWSVGTNAALETVAYDTGGILVPGIECPADL